MVERLFVIFCFLNWMQYIVHGNYPTQNNYESHPRSLSILCEKVLVPFIWLLFWWKTRAWITRNESEAFHSCESRWLLAGVLHWNRRKTGSRAAADVLWHVTVPGLHWRILSPRHELNYGGLHDIMIMSHRSWLTQSGQKKLLCLKIKKCSLKILITGLIYLIKDSWNEMKCQSEMLIWCLSF